VLLWLKRSRCEQFWEKALDKERQVSVEKVNESKTVEDAS